MYRMNKRVKWFMVDHFSSNVHNNNVDSLPNIFLSYFFFFCLPQPLCLRTPLMTWLANMLVTVNTSSASLPSTPMSPFGSRSSSYTLAHQMIASMPPSPSSTSPTASTATITIPSLHKPFKKKSLYILKV